MQQRERDQKVRDWQKFLKDKEASKIKLPEFHIDEYETKILDALPEDSTKSVTFSSVVENKSAEEVARFFAATLQLVSIIQENNTHFYLAHTTVWKFININRILIYIDKYKLFQND